jgi:hypothetical protein
LGPSITTPNDDVALVMTRSAQVRVTVDFTATARPESYLVEIEPKGGSTVGSWGGSAHIDANNCFTFSDVPPGSYVLTGRPNPGSEREQTKPVTVELQGGQTTEVTLHAQ